MEHLYYRWLCHIKQFGNGADFHFSSPFTNVPYCLQIHFYVLRFSCTDVEFLFLFTIILHPQSSGSNSLQIFTSDDYRRLIINFVYTRYLEYLDPNNISYYIDQFSKRQYVEKIG